MKAQHGNVNRHIISQCVHQFCVSKSIFPPQMKTEFQMCHSQKTCLAYSRIFLRPIWDNSEKDYRKWSRPRVEKTEETHPYSILLCAVHWAMRAVLCLTKNDGKWTVYFLIWQCTVKVWAGFLFYCVWFYKERQKQLQHVTACIHTYF